MTSSLALLSSGAIYYAVHDVVLTFEFVDEIQKCDIQWAEVSQSSYMYLLCWQYKVVLTFESVCEILKCGHSSESIWAALSHAV